MIADDDRQQIGGIQHMRDELAKNKYGIAWTVVPQASKVPGLKPVALAEREGGPYIVPSQTGFQSRTTPWCVARTFTSTAFFAYSQPGRAAGGPRQRQLLAVSCAN